MPVISLEVFALENQNRLHVRVDVLGCLKGVRGLEVGDSQLEHVEDVAIENAPNHQIVRSFLLVAAHGEQTAVILHRLVLDKRRVLHCNEVMRVSHQHLHSITPLHQLKVLQQVVDCLARLSAFHDDAFLGVLDEL